jgi:sortase (surface protein transpeptidase)
MVVGSTLSDVLEVAKKPTPQQLKEVEEKEVKKESWSQQKQHKKVLEKGVPDDAMPGLKVPVAKLKIFHDM